MHATTYEANGTSRFIIFDNYSHGIGWVCSCGKLNLGAESHLPETVRCLCGLSWSRIKNTVYDASQVTFEGDMGYGDDAIVEMDDEEDR